MKFLLMSASALIVFAGVSASACECAFNKCVTEAAGDQAKITACEAEKKKECTCPADMKCQCSAKDKAKNKTKKS